MKKSGTPIKKNSFRAKEGRKKVSEKPANKRKSPGVSEKKYSSDKPYQKKDNDGAATDKPYERKSYRKDADKGDYKKREHKPYDKDRETGYDRPARKYPLKTEGGERKSYGDKPNKPYNKESPRSERPYKSKPYGKDADKGGYKKREYKTVDKDRETRSDRPVEKYPYKKEGDERKSYGDKPYNKESPRSEKPYKRKTYGKEPDKGEYKNREHKSYDKDAKKGSERTAEPYVHKKRNEDSKPYADKPSFSKNKRPRVAESKTYVGRKREFRDTEIYVKDNTYAKRPSFREPSETKGVRLNKFIANAGICSRREADTLIETGVISINGKIITQLGTKVMPGDVVKFNDQTLTGEQHQYLLLNKPKDYLTTTDDPQERKTVMEIIKGACKERIYPVGRLDKNTSGLLLFTNDGELAKRLTHPKYQVEKVYKAELDKVLLSKDMDKIAEGIELEDGLIKVDAIAYGETKKEVGIELHSGKNRIVRRIFESLGYDVMKLDRVVFAGLTKKELPRGKYRFLSNEEVNILRRIK